MYDILFSGKSVGNAQLEKEGLYYRIRCGCKPPDDGVYRVIVSDGSNRQDLGICVPEGKIFVVNKRVPCKSLTGEQLTFYLVEKSYGEVVVPVADGEPFEYLDQLEDAHLRVADGQAEIIIAPTPDQQGSDQNQEYPHKWE